MKNFEAYKYDFGYRKDNTASLSRQNRPYD